MQSGLHQAWDALRVCDICIRGTANQRRHRAFIVGANGDKKISVAGEGDACE